jgi:hypothetical protein
MKKILIVIALVALTIGATAQTVKKDSTGYTYASIADVAIWPATATRISISILSDNLDKDNGAAVFQYRMMDESGVRLKTGSITIEGNAYLQWNANSLENTYQMVCDKLKLTIVD